MNEATKLIVELQCSINELRKKNTDLQKELDDLEVHNEQLQSLLSTENACISKIKAQVLRDNGKLIAKKIADDFMMDMYDEKCMWEIFQQRAIQLEGDTE